MPRINLGAYDQPFSGVGVEFDPLGLKPGRTGITLHETGYLEMNTHWNFPGVFSPFWRLYSNAKRGHLVLFNEQMTELLPGRIVLIPPHSLFHCLGANPVPSFWMSFSFSGVPHPDCKPPLVLETRDTELCLIRDISGLVRDTPDAHPTDALYRNSLALLQVTLARPELVWRPPLPDNLRRVRTYIESHLAEKLPAGALARIAGMSIAGFNRAFRKHLGTSPARHVTEIRVREAARLLLQDTPTIDDIAESIGFPHRAYLSRIFKQVTGHSPAAFRRQHRPE